MNNDLTCCFSLYSNSYKKQRRRKKRYTPYGLPHENKDYLLYYVYRDHCLKHSCVLFKEKSPRS